MIASAVSTAGGLARIVGVTIFVTVLAGLPIAVEFTDASEAVWATRLQARTNEAIAISSPIRVSEHLALTLDSGLVSMPVRNAAADDDARMLVVEEGQLTLDFGQAPPVAPSPVPSPRATGIPDIASIVGGALRLRRATVVIVGPSRNQIVLKDVNATVTASRKGTHKLAGTGQYNGQRLSFDAMWSDVAARGGAPQIPLRLSVKSNFLEATLDGVVGNARTPTFDGNAEFRMASLRRFIAWSGLGPGVNDHLRSINLSGPLNWTTARMAFPRAVIEIDGNKATGALTIDHGSKRLSIDGTLAVEELDLGSYWRSRPQPESVAAPAATPSFLAMFDADLRLSAAKIRTPNLQIGRGAVTIALTDGRLQADLAGIEIEDGTADGQLKLDVNPAVPRATLKFKVKGVDAGRLLASTLRPNALLGRTNLTFDGVAEGRTLSEAIMTLAGRGQFELVEPGRLGLDLSALISAARGTAAVNWSAAGKGSTALDVLNGRFRVLNGALSIEGLQARAATTAFMGAGRLDVPGRLMDMHVVSGPAAQGEAPVNAQDVLVLRGTWDNPAISLLKPEKPAAKSDSPVRVY